MHLIQILLPVHDEHGHVFPTELYEKLSQDLTARFGGVTSYMRAPAEGRWDQGGETEHDEIVVVEVMAEDLDRDWWGALRARLTREFKQDEVVVRTHPVERL